MQRVSTWSRDSFRSVGVSLGKQGVKRLQKARELSLSISLCRYTVDLEGERASLHPYNKDKDAFHCGAVYVYVYNQLAVYYHLQLCNVHYCLDCNYFFRPSHIGSDTVEKNASNKDMNKYG